MTQIIAYLKFDGNCQSAITFYKECLGGELTIQTVGNSPMAAHMPPEAREKVMHASLSKDGVMIMASDMIRGKLTKGNTISLCINSKNEAEIKTFFSNLSQGGTIIEELKEQFWGGVYGEITDKFGVNWMLNYDKNPNV